MQQLRSSWSLLDTLDILDQANLELSPSALAVLCYSLTPRCCDWSTIDGDDYDMAFNNDVVKQGGGGDEFIILISIWVHISCYNGVVHRVRERYVYVALYSGSQVCMRRNGCALRHLLLRTESCTFVRVYLRTPKSMYQTETFRRNMFCGHKSEGHSF